MVLSDDISATLGAVASLGAEIKIDDSSNYSGRKLITINSESRILSEEKVIDCIESGSTARFMMPITRLDESSSTFTGRGRLIERPFNIYKNLFSEKGITYRIMKVKCQFIFQKLVPGTYNLSGDVSSQFVSGLLLHCRFWMIILKL